MKASSIYLSLICCLLLSSGQVLFKLAADKIKSVSSMGNLFFNLLFNGYLMCGLTLYGLATLLWVWILRDTPLSLVYPIVALSYVIVPILSIWIFHEGYEPKVIYGSLLIILGVYVAVA